MKEEILRAIRSILMDDATLATLAGGVVRAYPQMAPPDTSFPYITFNLELTGGQDISSNGMLLFDTWDKGPNALRATSIQERLEGLFWLRRLQGDQADLRVSGEAPRDILDRQTPEVWKTTLILRVRVIRNKTNAQLMEREGA